MTLMPASPTKRPRPDRSRTAQDPDGAVETSRRPGKRRDREVIDAAAKVFYERGYADASVQDIADELGILKGSLYHYIASKEDLLFRLLVELHDEVLAILEEVASEQGLDPLERLAVYVRRQVLFNLENLPRVAVYYNDYERLGPERRAQIMARRRLHERYVIEVIREAQRAGLANPDLDARLLSNYIHGSFLWTYRWFRPGGKVSREKVAATCAQFVLSGVAGGNPRPERPR
jgi:TetR/AcrR family transcriptional regulator, cholesterol catabolism regulator